MRYLFHVSVIIAAGCLSDSESYTPEKDNEAIAAISHVFSGPGTGGLTLSLCEDVDAVEDTNSCQVDHTVRGGGRGREHEVSGGGVGCGGCPLKAVAMVRGTLSGGGLTAPQMVKGEIVLGYGAGDDAYGFPYQVTLSCEGTPSCYVSGLLEEDGSLQVSFSTTTSAEVALVAGAAASCP